MHRLFTLTMHALLTPQAFHAAAPGDSPLFVEIWAESSPALFRRLGIQEVPYISHWGPGQRVGARREVVIAPERVSKERFLLSLWSSAGCAWQHPRKQTRCTGMLRVTVCTQPLPPLPDAPRAHGVDGRGYRAVRGGPGGRGPRIHPTALDPAGVVVSIPRVRRPPRFGGGRLGPVPLARGALAKAVDGGRAAGLVVRHEVRCPGGGQQVVGALRGPGVHPGCIAAHSRATRRRRHTHPAARCARPPLPLPSLPQRRHVHLHARPAARCSPPGDGGPHLVALGKRAARVHRGAQVD